MPAAQPAAASASAQARGTERRILRRMRYVVIAMLLLIVASLGSALVFMMQRPRRLRSAW